MVFARFESGVHFGSFRDVRSGQIPQNISVGACNSKWAGGKSASQARNLMLGPENLPKSSESIFEKCIGGRKSRENTRILVLDQGFGLTDRKCRLPSEFARFESGVAKINTKLSESGFEKSSSKFMGNK